MILRKREKRFDANNEKIRKLKIKILHQSEETIQLRRQIHRIPPSLDDYPLPEIPP